MITREQLVEMFDNMAQETPWDLSKPLVWGYFFTHRARPALEAVVPLLQDQGYRVIALYLEDKDNRKDPDLWWLHVEKTEVHTPDSLHERNRRCTASPTSTAWMPMTAWTSAPSTDAPPARPMK